MASTEPSPSRVPYSYWLVGATALLLFLIRFTGPPDLADNFHQERQASYVLDILQNGHWACQRDPYGDIASKPPLHAWLSALASIVCGGFSWFTLVLPGALATTGTALLLLHAGRRYFSEIAGILAALFFLISSVGLRQLVQGRIDGLFAFTTTTTALLAFRSWQLGRGWTWFWLSATLATLAKGPLGLVLGSIGLLAAIWEKRRGTSHPVVGWHWLGIIIWAVVSAGWFALAYSQFGQPFLDKVLGKELVGHAVIGRSGGVSPFREFYLPTVNLLARFAPWSLLTCYALWRVCKRPSAEDWTRRFERFLFCWLVGGIVIFSVAAHQRPDLIYPLSPPAALLAGAVAAHWLRNLRKELVLKIAVVLAFLGLTAAATQYHWLRRDHKLVKRTLVTRSVAEFVRTNVGPHFPLVHVNEDYAVQAYLRTMVSYVSTNRAAELLAGPAPTFVLVQNSSALAPSGETSPWHVLFRTAGRDGLSLISNHPRLEWTSDLVFDLNTLELRLHNARLHRLSLHDLVLQRVDTGARVEILNRALSPQHFRVRWLDDPIDAHRVLMPGERWVINARSAR